MRKKILFYFLFFAQVYAQGSIEFESDTEQLFRDLELVQKIDAKADPSLPLMVNFQLQGGYFAMPSARTFQSGELGFGLAYASPFHIWSLGLQLFDHLEVTGNYWSYNSSSFFSFSDNVQRTFNTKFVLLRKEDGFPYLPDFALGFNDIIGWKNLYSFYVVMTKEWPFLNLETTLGWGKGYIHGFYGGIAYTPFRHSKYFWKNFLLSAEYDATDYHRIDKKVDYRINVGAQVSLWDLFRFSVSSLRGNDFAASGSFHYNFGQTKGLFPKIYDPPVYVAPVDIEPINHLRSQHILAQEMAYALREQGFDLYTLYLVPAKHGQDDLWMKVINVRYWEEEEVRFRLQQVLSNLIPSNISRITVVLESDGVAMYEYRFNFSDLEKFRENKIGLNELRTIAPIREASKRPDQYESTLMYQRKKPIWTLTFRPWFRPFFGSDEGKFKYELGAIMGFEGYLFDQVYYALNGNYTAKASTQKIADEEDENPSRLLNVRTDTLRYNKTSSLHVEQAYLQRSFNWGKGWFSRLAAGYFEMAYTGIALETLCYPIHANWAVGFQGATFLKRNYFGMGFQHKVRKFTQKGEKFFPYVGVQYFLDLYYQYRPLNLDFKASVGQFLARDKGIRFDAGKFFESGLRIGFWYTLTNGKDTVNGKRYYDKGFSISMPMDFFLNKSSLSRIGYSISARLRDVGAIAQTGKPLYPTLFWGRFNACEYVK